MAQAGRIPRGPDDIGIAVTTMAVGNDGIPDVDSGEGDVNSR